MIDELEVDPEKIVHEENYEVNLGNGIQEEEIVLPTQLNTQENNEINQPFVSDRKKIMTEVFYVVNYILANK